MVDLTTGMKIDSTINSLATALIFIHIQRGWQIGIKLMIMKKHL